jgi:hypothetical protein
MVSTRKGHDGVDVLGLIHRGSETVLRHHVLAEFNPFAPGRGVIVPVELRMVSEDLYAAAHQYKDAEQSDETVDPKPEWKS